MILLVQFLVAAMEELHLFSDPDTFGRVDIGGFQVLLVDGIEGSQNGVDGVEGVLGLLFPGVLRVGVEGVLEALHVVAEGCEGSVHPAGADAHIHVLAVDRLEPLIDQVQGDIDILVHDVLFVPADVAAYGPPGRGAQGHVGTVEQVLPVVGPVDGLADGVVALEPDPLAWHVIVGHRSSGAHGLGVPGEDAGDHLHPIGTEHAVGVNPAQHIAGCPVKSVIAGGDQPLFTVLMEKLDMLVRVLIDEVLDDGGRCVCGVVVDYQHLLGCLALPGGVQ